MSIFLETYGTIKNLYLASDWLEVAKFIDIVTTTMSKELEASDLALKKDFYFWSGQANLHLEKFDSAENFFGKLIEICPSEYLGYQGIIDINFYKRDWDNVIALAKNFQLQFPELWMSDWWLGQAYIKIGSFSDSEKRFKTLIAHYPNEMWGYQGMVDLCCENSRWEDVIKYALILEEVNILSWHRYWWRTVGYLNLGNLVKAQENVDLLIREYPNDKEGYLGNIYLANKKMDWSIALEWINLGIIKFPILEEFYYLKGITLIRLQRYHEADQWLAIAKSSFNRILEYQDIIDYIKWRKIQKQTKPLLNKYSEFFTPAFYHPTSISITKDREIKKIISLQWDIFIEGYFKGELANYDILAKKKIGHNKIIWQYWGQGINSRLPDIVKICFNSVDKYKADYEVIRLDDKNLSDFLEFPAFIQIKRENPQFKYPFLADLLRLALLKAYGGVWLDATVLLTGELPSYLTQQDFFMYQRKLDVPSEIKQYWHEKSPYYFGWSNNHFVNILNSVIISKSNNPLITICLDLLLNFWETQSGIPHYFFFQIMYEILTQYHKVDSLVISDILPHLLQVKLNENFNCEDFTIILQKTNIHKLSIIKDTNKKSYYNYLKVLYDLSKE